MKIVSENSDRDLGRERSSGEVQAALRNFTANLMRITRGAGKPSEVGYQAQALIAALDAYFTAVGHYPFEDEISRALDIEYEAKDLQQYPREEVHRIYAKQTLICGALQISASRLLGQRTQEASGNHELYAGIREIEDLRRETRAARSAVAAAPEKAAKPPSLKPKAKPKA